MSAVLYCHRNQIVHRDLKPENVLFTKVDNESNNFCLKLIDFGVSSINKNKKIKGMYGTPYYVAPEIIKQ